MGEMDFVRSPGMESVPRQRQCRHPPPLQERQRGPITTLDSGREARQIRRRNFPIECGGSPEPPREPPAVGAFTRRSCAAGQVEDPPWRKTRRANRSPVTQIRGCREPPRPALPEAGNDPPGQSAAPGPCSRQAHHPPGMVGSRRTPPSAAAQTPDVATGPTRRPEQKVAWPCKLPRCKPRRTSYALTLNIPWRSSNDSGRRRGETLVSACR